MLISERVARSNAVGKRKSLKILKEREMTRTILDTEDEYGSNERGGLTRGKKSEHTRSTIIASMSQSREPTRR